MSTIPTRLTEKALNQYVRPYISVVQRGYECSIPLYKILNYILYKLHTGCQWEMLPIKPSEDGFRQKEITHHAVSYHYRKWSKDGSLEKVWQGSILDDLNLSELNFDGTHSIAKKSGKSVAYQGRKKSQDHKYLTC